MAAQNPSRLSGFVADAITSRRLADATLEVVGDSLQRTVRTDEQGQFTVVLPAGSYRITTHRVGYEVAVTPLRMPSADSSVAIRLTPIAVALPGVDVKAHGPDLHGAVASSHGLTPIAGARLQIIGSGRIVETDSTGHYWIALPKPGAYVIRASRAGYVDQMVTVQIHDSSTERVVLLDPGTAAPIPKVLLQEFDERLRWQAYGAAFVPGSELREYGGSTIDALAAAHDVIRRGLHLGSDICLFVNGVPRPGWPLDAIPVDRIENVELYTAGGEVTNTLGPEWPYGAPCSDGRSKATNTAGGGRNTGAVRLVVIWLRR